MCVADIELWVALGQRGLFFLLVFGADILAKPEIVLLVSFLVGIVIGKTDFDLFSSRPFHSLCELEILADLFFDKLFRNVLVNVEPWLSFGLECGEVGLYPDM